MAGQVCISVTMLVVVVLLAVLVLVVLKIAGRR